jgi:cell wall-associated NlpC family hydrolase
MRTKPFFAGLLAAVLAGTRPAPAATLPVPASGVVGVQDDMLSASYWVARAPAPDAVILTPAQITAENARLFATDPTTYDLSKFGPVLRRAQITAWIGKLSKLPQRPLLDAENRPIPQSVLQSFTANLALDRIPASVPTRYGLAIRRAALRTFPTRQRVFTEPDNQDIDRFQESTLFPGDPVVIAHASADGGFLFVVSARYAAWVDRAAIAEGSARQVLWYEAATPFRIITGARVFTVFNPDSPALSELPLDMGARIKLADVAPDQPVDGQDVSESWALQLPVRGAGGALQFRPALLPRIADSAPGYLPFTQANIIRQAFKFLGERYGWGNDYDGRDCSGFVSDVYRSMGVQMPRNTGDQATSPALPHRLFTVRDTHADRVAAIAAAKIGDLVYIPGHVMMIAGFVGTEPYVIHDTGGLTFKDSAGNLRNTRTNEVTLSPLLPLLTHDQRPYIDVMTSLVHLGQ